MRRRHPAHDSAHAPAERPPRDHKVRDAFLVSLAKMLPALLVILGVAAAALLFLPVFGKPIISLTTVDETSVSELVLEEVRTVCRLSTIEYHYKIVFPYDFGLPGTSEATLYERLRRQLSGRVQDLVTPEEKLWLRAVNLAKASGLKPYAPDFQFIVATVNVRGGFDLDAHPPSVETVISPKAGPGGRDRRAAVVRLPPAGVTAAEVEDPDRDSYPFPDVALSPAGWKEISGFIRDRAVERALAAGIAREAAARAEAVLKPLLSQAGYDEITVRWD